MKSKEFLKDRLFQIYLVLKNINIKYQYFNESNLHLVEVTPLSEFIHNKEYISMEKQLVADFKRNFSSSKLVFVSEKSLMRVKAAEFSYIREKGKNLIENRSLKSYSPFFSLTVTSDPQNFRRL